METLELTWVRTIQLWWSFMWRMIVVGTLAGFVAGALTGMVLGALGKLDDAAMAGGIAGYVVSLPVSVWALKKMLGLSFGEFSIKLVKNSPDASTTTAM